MSTAVKPYNTAEMTADEREAASKVAYEQVEAIKSELAKVRSSLWDVAKILVDFDEASGWRALNYENLGDWLADPEINMTRQTYYRLTGAYRTLVIQNHVPVSTLGELEVSKVDIVLPKLRAGKVKLDKALDDAKELGTTDLREMYTNRKKDEDDSNTNGGPPDVDGTAKTVTVDEKPVRADEVGVDTSWHKTPSKKEFEEMRARAKKRRRNFVHYAQVVGHWLLLSDDGSERAHWSTQGPPEPPPDNPDPDTPDVDEDAPESGAEAAGILDQAHDDWVVLHRELISGLNSGAENPRIPAKAIRAGVQGVNLIIKDWRKLNGVGIADGGRD